MSGPPDGAERLPTASREGRARLRDNHARFAQAVDRVRREAARGAWEAAVRDARAAARQARDQPCGLYASGQLEEILLALGRAQVPCQAVHEISRTRAPSPRRILHVATQVRPMGGLTRMMSHWMTSDGGREQWLALTGQRRPVPEDLERAVAGSGGKIAYIGEVVGGQIRQARALRALAVQVDLVVLHIDFDDVVAFVALADRRGLPPVLYLDHADHVFWLGVSVSDLVVALRPSYQPHQEVTDAAQSREQRERMRPGSARSAFQAAQQASRMLS